MNASEFRTIEEIPLRRLVFTAKLLLLLTLTPLVTGCATAPTGETLAQPDYGTEITQAEAERLFSRTSSVSFNRRGLVVEEGRDLRMLKTIRRKRRPPGPHVASMR